MQKRFVAFRHRWHLIHPGAPALKALKRADRTLWHKDDLHDIEIAGMTIPES